MNEPRNIGQANGKILVMEEDSALRTLIGKMLTNHGYEINPARDGIEAIELYQIAQASGPLMQ
jgi:CheY-like chemotaxis protein